MSVIPDRNDAFSYLRIMRHARRPSLVLAITLCTTGCFSLYDDPQYPKDNIIGEVYVTPTNISRWEDFRQALQPKFTLSADDAYKQVLANTLITQRQEIDYQRLGVAVGLPGTTTAGSTSVNQTLGNDGVSTTDTTGNLTYTYSPGSAPDLSAARGTPPGTSVGDFSGQSLETDAMMGYWAAAALYQEVQLLNRVIEDATELKGYQAYVVRLQVSTMPYSRKSTLDTYITFSANHAEERPQEAIHSSAKKLAITGSERERLQNKLDESQDNLDSADADLDRVRKTINGMDPDAIPLAIRANQDAKRNIFDEAKAARDIVEAEYNAANIRLLHDRKRLDNAIDRAGLQHSSDVLLKFLSTVPDTTNNPVYRVQQMQHISNIAYSIKTRNYSYDHSTDFEIQNRASYIQAEADRDLNNPGSFDLPASFVAGQEIFAISNEDKSFSAVALESGANIQIIPMLVADNIELSQNNRSARQIRDTALALQAVVQNAGININQQIYREVALAALGQDYNSLLMVTKNADNSIRIRLGALNSPSTRYATVPRNHYITFVLLVKDSNGSIDNIVFKDSVEMRDARNGNLVAASDPSKRMHLKLVKVDSLLPLPDTGESNKGKKFKLPTLDQLPDVGGPYAGQVVFLRDDGKNTTAKLLGGQRINPSYVDAWLEGTDNDGHEFTLHHLTASTDAGGTNLNLSWSSLSKMGLAKTGDQPELHLMLDRRRTDTRIVTPLATAFRRTAPKTAPEPKSKLTAVVDHITIDSTTGNGRVDLKIDWKKEDQALKLKLTNAILAPAAQGIVAADGSMTMPAASGKLTVTLQLAGLRANLPVVINLTNADKETDAGLKLQVIKQ